MKFIISWDIGYGPEFAEVEAANESEAYRMAYECWKENAEDYAVYSAEEWTEELAEEYHL